MSALALTLMQTALRPHRQGLTLLSVIAIRAHFSAASHSGEGTLYAVIPSGIAGAQTPDHQ
jgi:hypothetical protein